MTKCLFVRNAIYCFRLVSKVVVLSDDHLLSCSAVSKIFHYLSVFVICHLLIFIFQKQPIRSFVESKQFFFEKSHKTSVEDQRVVKVSNSDLSENLTYNRRRISQNQLKAIVLDLVYRRTSFEMKLKIRSVADSGID